jgi:hypothetical protein
MKLAISNFIDTTIITRGYRMQGPYFFNQYTRMDWMRMMRIEKKT